MTPQLLASTLGALVAAWALFHHVARVTYICPTCGARRADDHTDECPWKPG